MGAGGDELPQAVIVAGPTASGKSALALGLAQRLGGVVINADAMQCYRELRIVTARPSEAETALVPHALYGVRPAAEAGTAAWWRATWCKRRRWPPCRWCRVPMAVPPTFRT